ncbi:uncharacterized protein CG43867 isoform X3 [Parasteatoda tepidariorum]|uniref:uncharacterized protein CG43867 isoform X3 n=2 Tax=Parasteatoda tepidariorum TaxID=114398 RepID=UPI0039BCE3C2
MIGHCYQKMIDRLSRSITSDMADPDLARLGPIDRLSMASSARSSLPSIMGEGEEGGGEASWNQGVADNGHIANNDDEIDWKKKCEDLQSTLVEIREQTEEKAQVMEEQFYEIKRRASPTNICICDLTFCFESDRTCSHKECMISSLEHQIEEQKRLRVCDAKQVEDKASKIKEWVKNKLKELEEQNQHLKEQNHKCNVQLEFLRDQLSELSSPKIPHKKVGDRGSAEDSSRGSYEENVDSDDSLPPPETLDYSSQAAHMQEVLKEHIFGITDEYNHIPKLPIKLNQNCPPNILYASVDYLSKKQKHIPCQTMTEPPKIRLERKKYAPDCCLTPSTISTTSEHRFSEMDCPSWNHSSSRIGSGLVDVETPTSPELESSFPAISSQNVLEDDCLSQRQSFSVPEPHDCQSECLCHIDQAYLQSHVPKSHKIRPLTAPNACVSDLERLKFLESSNHNHKPDKNVITLENFPCSLNLYGNHICHQDELHDYAEIYTPNKECIDFYTNNDGCESTTTNEAVTCTKAPTPPLHRFPSWESRIYDVALSGINVPIDTFKAPLADTSNNNQAKSSTDTSNSNAAFTELSIPVYATVNGRASQIRSVPFTGESSDSSDNEDTRVTMITTSSQTTSGDTESSTSIGANAVDHSPVDKKVFMHCRKLSNSTLPPCPTSSTVSKYHSTTSSPMKQRELSSESILSDDYAVPPDAVSIDEISMTDNRPSLNNTPTFYRKIINCDDSIKKETLEKCGFLTKLGGKFKTWRRRWFVLRNGTLSYYKSQTDVNRKPQGQIVLDDVCRVNRAYDAATFEISTGKRVYYLTADSINMMEEWIKVLQNVLRQNATKLLLTKDDKPTIEGWLTKVKHGHARRSWCVLIGRMFLYFKTPNDCNPLGQINMRDARVEEVSHVSDSDDEDHDHNKITKSECTIGIFPNHQGPTYLLMDNKQEMDSWLYNLTVVSSGHNLAGTQTEQLFAKLMEVDGDESSPIWKHPLLLYTKDSLSQPLTTLPSEQLQMEAVKLFKSIQLFISVPMDTSGIEYHVALAQNSLQHCLIYQELQNELFCQLIKQTSRHCHHKSGVQQLIICATQSLFMCDTSSTEKGTSVSTGNTEKPIPSESKFNPAPFVFVQAWQLLSLAVSLFLPKNRTLWYLRIHLQRNANTKFEAGKYAIFCQRALERTLANGGRECKPSRMEVLSIFMKNPYHHSLPHSIPVHFLNGTYQVFGFDGSTTVHEFIETVNREVGIRDCEYSGFALFSDDPIEKDLEHCLLKDAKLCDVISQWEQALREQHFGKFENTKVLKLIYKNRIILRQNMKAETDKERLLLVYQINEDIVDGKFPLSKELAVELASLLAQIEFGDLPNEMHYGSETHTKPKLQLVQALDKFFPKHLRNASTDRKLCDSIKEKWIGLKGCSITDCVRVYLNCARKWSFTGGKLFPAKLKCDAIQNVWLAVAENCIAVLDAVSLQCLVQYPYSSVLTFGGCREDFMLVINCGDIPGERNQCSTERLLFNMTKPKILELTLLIADYMNATVQNAQYNKRSGSAVPSSPKGSISTVYNSDKIQSKIRANHTVSQSSNTTTGSIPLDSSPDHAKLSLS